MISTVLFQHSISRWIKTHQGSKAMHWLLGMLSITLATVIWGYSNVVIRQGELAMPVSILLWMRFGLAGILLIPTVFRLRLSRKHWCIGLGTGALLGVSVLAQGWAMVTIPVDEVAFITALYVVFTPIGAAFLQRIRPHKALWISVIVSMVGVVLLIGHLTFDLKVGILWAFLAAVGFSAQIIGTTEITKYATSIQITGLQSVGAGLAMTVWLLIQGSLHPSIYHGLFHWSKTAWIWIGYLAILATVVACFLQAWGQARLSSAEAALIFNMEPVWTAVFAWLILSQKMTVPQIVGALLIVSSLTMVSKPAKVRP
ncbi:DMT family transporter [Alicyclobacillus herbarius]|uniref:DMT family transporter n=1 Tax=Alicyclobacillus herbarius TaxID=122960 RepID=UPI0003F52317|nr:DMT family transporter [Alicyclobacillus herbarius]